MDTYLRLALLLLGIVVVAVIVWDGYRKKRLNRGKSGEFNQEALDQMMESRDLGGFDLDGVGLSRILGNAQLDAELLPEFNEPLVATRDEPIMSEENFSASAEQDPVPASSEPELIITMSIIARSENGFVGEKLLHCMLSRGLRYGKMNIFHRHKNTSGEGPTQFSLANALNPGTFDLDDMSSFQTKAITLFMMLPGPKEPLKSYKLMLETAQHFSTELDGQLVDDSRSVLTKQTIQHYQEQIQDYERRNLSNNLNNT